MLSARRLTASTVAVLCLSIALLGLASAPALAASGSSLPDNRSYELVSTIEGTEVFPPEAGQTASFESERDGELLANVGGYRAAANGDAIAYIGGLSPTGVGGYGVAKNGNGNLYLSQRGQTGWEAGDIEPVSLSRQIEGFSADVSQQVFNIGEPRFNEEHGGPTACSEGGGLYTREGNASTGRYQSLAADPSTSGEECEQLTFAGISEDNQHALMQSPGAYTPGATKGEEGSPEGPSSLTGSEGFDNLYDRVGGQLYQVNILPDGKPESSPYAIFGGRTSLVYKRHFEHNFANDVSSDGSRVFWTDLNTGVLYVRENDNRPQSPIGPNGECTISEDACTVQVDAAEPKCVSEGACASGGGVFWAASSDGSRVFFTDCARLTSDSTAVSSGNCEGEEEINGYEVGVPTGHDLYEYNVETGRLTDLTVDHNGADAFGADVQGVIGASADGSNVYFVGRGILAGKNANGTGPEGGKPNLYLTHEDQITFIATLENADNEFVGTRQQEQPGTTAGDWRTAPGLRTAGAAPNGQAVAFMSRRSLTGYDNYGLLYYDDGNRSQPVFGDIPEVFVYEMGTGQLVCASCSPTGEPPVQLTGEEWEHATGGHVGVSGSSTFMSRWISSDGTQVYFDTSQPLVSRDTNQRQDVYEWASDGSGDCKESSGCIALLSGGDIPHDAYFLDASESGDDVFFTTREQLLSSALGESVKLYDARVDGGFPEYTLACTGTGCQGVPPAAPIFATPSSVTFSGVGNFPPLPTVKAVAKSKKPLKCKIGFMKKRGRCVSTSKHRKRIKKITRTSTMGRK